MKTVYELSKELQAGLFDLHKESGFDSLCQEITKRVANMKSEVLTAWFALNTALNPAKLYWWKSVPSLVGRSTFGRAPPKKRSAPEQPPTKQVRHVNAWSNKLRCPAWALSMRKLSALYMGIYTAHIAKTLGEMPVLKTIYYRRWHMQSIEYRYNHDPMVKALVDSLEHHIHALQFTPSEIRECAMLAAIRYEQRRPPQSFMVQNWHNAQQTNGAGPAEITPDYSR